MITELISPFEKEFYVMIIQIFEHNGDLLKGWVLSDIWYEWRHTAWDTKLILLVTLPCGSGIYDRLEGSRQANCSSGRKRNERDRHCLYIYLRLSPTERIIAVISIGPQSLAPFIRVVCLSQYFAIHAYYGRKDILVAKSFWF